MKALVFHGPGKRTWEEHADPAIQEPTDAVVRITTTTICGTDLHILRGDVPTVTPGRILARSSPIAFASTRSSGPTTRSRTRRANGP